MKSFTILIEKVLEKKFTVLIETGLAIVKDFYYNFQTVMHIPYKFIASYLTIIRNDRNRNKIFNTTIN